MKGDQRKRTF